MKRSIVAIFTATLLLSTAAFVVRSDVRSAEDTELTKIMKSINKATRSLRACLKDPKRSEEALKIVCDLQAKSLAAKSLDPEMKGTIEAAKQAQFIVDYRKEMHLMLNQLFAVEIAVMEGRTDDAKAELKKLLKAKSPAHKKFQLQK